MSQTLRLSVLLFGLVLIASQTLAQRRPKDKILDRRVFVVTMEQQRDRKNKLEPFEEELSFRSNRMSSKHMRSQAGGGFMLGDYAVSKVEKVMDENVIHFQAINKNQKGMSLKWEGKVFGGRVEGTAIVSKKGKIKQEFVFSGALKQKKKR